MAVVSFTGFNSSIHTLGEVGVGWSWRQLTGLFQWRNIKTLFLFNPTPRDPGTQQSETLAVCYYDLLLRTALIKTSTNPFINKITIEQNIIVEK
jgi:hypothetical protein